MWGRGPLATTRKFFAALDSGDLGACARLMHPDIRFVDSRGNTIEGVAVCSEMLQRLFVRSAGFSLEVESMAPAGETTLVKGEMISADPRLAGQVLWRVKVEHGLVREVESHRADTRSTNRLLVPEYLDRGRGAALA
jgi:limonene-1,2-epoxide hydrolase